MTLANCQDLWNMIQEEKIKILEAWQPTEQISTVSIPEMITGLQETLSGIFNTDLINELEQSLAKAEGELAPEDFRSWNLKRGERARQAGAIQSEKSVDKLRKLLFA